MKKSILMLLCIALLNITAKGEDAKKLFKKYGCEGCHSDYGIVAGPAFYMVKERYMKKFNGDKEALKKYLYQTIRKGSSGKWFNFIDMKMPSHPQIKEDEMKVIIDYIVNLKPPKKESK
ncbi:Cytochrome c551/c552 [Persephonella hydrogeniphila]|uniref:Cytochrome c551/c552 n=1 Tax=Persephonella hydrogeniphila TaxID=198703 RepID=A0A285NHB2_9AQUI|nr:c-type cytochrome [Persephonella hydrogeniphila]SNZ08902.1 Cytochrome c551/c552 [Persephonella hydrogeniphila]